MTILERLLRHDAWTTGELLKLAAGLTDAELDREFDMGHRTLRRTLAHMVGNMEVWCDLIAGVPQRGRGGDSVEALRLRLEAVAGELLVMGNRVVAEGREEAFFVDDLDMPARRKTLGAGLVHVATHGMHHRAQCLYMMRRLSVEGLPEGDALGWERAHRGGEWPLA